MQWFQGVAEPFKCGNPGRLCIPGYCKSSIHGNNASWFSRPNSETAPECSENNSLSAGWSYRPQNHQASLPEAQGAHPKTQRLSKFARVKKGGLRVFFCALGGPTGPLGLEPQRTGRVLWDTGRYRLYHCRISASLLTTSNPPCHVPKGKHWRCTRWRFGRPNTGGSAHLSIGWRITHGEN